MYSTHYFARVSSQIGTELAFSFNSTVKNTFNFASFTLQRYLRSCLFSGLEKWKVPPVW